MPSSRRAPHNETYFQTRTGSNLDQRSEAEAIQVPA